MAVGLALCLVALWPPWSIPVDGDAYIGMLYALMAFAQPLYQLVGDIGVQLANLSGLPVLFLRCVVVVTNWSTLGIVAGAGYFTIEWVLASHTAAGTGRR